MAKSEMERLRQENEAMKRCFGKILALDSMSDAEAAAFLGFSPDSPDLMFLHSRMCGYYVGCVQSAIEEVDL